MRMADNASAWIMEAGPRDAALEAYLQRRGGGEVAALLELGTEHADDPLGGGWKGR